MRVKGVKRGRNKERGEVIELTPEGKLKEAVSMAVTKHVPFEGNLVWVRDLVKKDLKSTTMDKPLRDLWENNQYWASGRAVFHFRNTKLDRVTPSKELDFKITFKDKLDGWGMPDLEVVNFETL